MLTELGKWRPSTNGLDFDRLGAEDAARLEELFSVEEVLFALLEMSGDKVPGLDGFSLTFWQFN